MLFLCVSNYKAFKKELMEQLKKRNRKRIFIWIASITLLLIVAIAAFLYSLVFKPIELTEEVYIYIDEERDYETVVDQLKEKVELPNEDVFRLLADRMN